MLRPGIFATLVLLAPATLFAQKPVPQDPDVHVDVRPDVKTGIESTTQYPTIQMAMDHAPDAGTGRVFVHIYPGVYHERVIVTQNRPRMTLDRHGLHPLRRRHHQLPQRQTGRRHLLHRNRRDQRPRVRGRQPHHRKHRRQHRPGRRRRRPLRQAPSSSTSASSATRTPSSPTSAASTTPPATSPEASTFIFGNATAVFDHSELHALAPGFLTAQSRIKPTETTGYVIANSRVT